MKLNFVRDASAYLQSRTNMVEDFYMGIGKNTDHKLVSGSFKRESRPGRTPVYSKFGLWIAKNVTTSKVELMQYFL